MKTESRRPWHNVGGNQTCTPRLSFWPESLEDLITIVRQAEADGATVRALGSGHSWSDVARTDDYLVYPEKLTIPLLLTDYGLRATLAFPAERLVRVQSGMTIRAINDYLDKRNLAFINLGGFDGQTIAGVTSTSTHGSGINFGPLSDFIRSIELVGSGGKVFRVEPSVESGRALTDATDFAQAHPDAAQWELIQDDTAFRAVTVGMGCMGLIYSLVLEVRPAFHLRETRTPLKTWPQIKESLKDGRIRNTPEHYEFVLNPYEVDGEHRCLETTRVETTQSGDGERNIFVRYRSILEIGAWWARVLAWIAPQSLKRMISTAIEALVDKDYTEKSFKVFHIGEANYLPAISAEFAVPVEGDAYLAAIDRLIEVAEEVGRKERLYLSAPVAVRFVKRTDSLLSMMNDRDTCMLEVIALAGVKNSPRIMQRIEEALVPFGVRPHWGQINNINRDRLVAMYGDRLATWQTVRRRFDPRGTFASPFTRRVGLD